jgi:uncharacterized protein (TIGR03067 family)
MFLNTLTALARHLPIMIALSVSAAAPTVVHATAPSPALVPLEQGAKQEKAPNVVNGLKLTLSLDKKETPMMADGSDCEPIILGVTYKNVSDRPLKLDMSMAMVYAGTHLEVSGPGVVKLTSKFKPPFDPAKVTTDSFRVLQPGEEYTGSQPFPVNAFCLDHFFLKKPGEYRIRMVHALLKETNNPLAKGSWTGTVTSNEVVLRVVPAVPKNEKGPDEEQAKERKKLLGTWSAVAIYKQGKLQSREDLRQWGWQDFKMTFRNQGVTFGRLAVHPYHIDPAKTPKEIDLMPLGDVDDGFNGIYKLEDDTLTLFTAHLKERPKEFRADPKVWSLLIVLKRQKNAAAAPLDADTLARINQADWAFTGKVTSKQVVAPLGNAFGRLELEFSDIKTLRGKPPAQPLRPPFEPTLDEEKDITWFVATDMWGRLNMMVPVHDGLLSRAKQLLALPLGWTLDNGQPLSPWAALGASAWPKTAKAGKEPVCCKTSRPALLAGENIEITTSQILPKVVHPSRNPFGDGQFKVTVTNRGATPVVVPALLSDSKNILWEDSLVVLSAFGGDPFSGTACLLPGAGKIGKVQAAQAVVLMPQEAVSTVVDVLQAKGVSFMPGASRYYYRFCLGEKSAVDFFYYHSDHHELLRKNPPKST